MPTLQRRAVKAKPTIKYATVVFKDAGRQYTFKTIYNLKPGDKVAVKTKNGLSTAEVFSTNTNKPKFECNWIIGKIDLNIMERNHSDDLKFYGILPEEA